MIRILVVDPVDASRRRVLAAVARHDAVTVVGVAATLSDAVESCLTVRPQVVALTIHESGDEDVAIVRALMRERPTPIVLVCAGSRVRAREVAFDALKAGALDVVEMPDTTSLPTAASGTPVTSTMVRSIVTRPRIGTRRPPTSISPRFESSHE